MDRSLFVGLMCYLICALIDTAVAILSRILKGMGWPFFRAFGTASFLAAVITTIFSFFNGARKPSRRAMKWVVARGLCGGAAFFSDVLAVQLGTPPGDVASLSSINTMMAAILGRLILGESLGWLHFVAFTMCMGGVTLIAKPAFIFGGDQSNQPPMFGYALALSSGFFVACIFILARLVDKVSPSYMSASTSFALSLCFMCLPVTPLVEDAPLSAAFDSLEWTCLAVVGFTLYALVAPWSFSKGAALCPAAVSATLNTGNRIAIGYAAQVVFFGVPPDAITLLGATLMLLSITLTTVARTHPNSSTSSNSISVSSSSGSSQQADQARSQTSQGVQNDAVPQVAHENSRSQLVENMECEPVVPQVTRSTTNISNISSMSHLGSRSLAVFIATEFTKRMPTKRRRGTHSQPSAQTIGSVAGAVGNLA